MSPSQEHDDAVGEAPSAAELLDVKRIELQQATAALEAAGLSRDYRRFIELEDEIDKLHRIIEKLTARTAVEAVAAAHVEAGELHAQLQQRYAEALAAL